MIDSNEAELLAILEGLRIFFPSFHGRLVVESSSLNAISWMSKSIPKPWSFQFVLNEIKFLVSQIQVEFCHVCRLANCLADFFTKQGVDRVVPWVVVSLYCGLGPGVVVSFFVSPFSFSIDLLIKFTVINQENKIFILLHANPKYHADQNNQNHPASRHQMDLLKRKWSAVLMQKVKSNGYEH